MFTRSRTSAPDRRQSAPREKGIATLRIYNSADPPFGCIYEEPVLGAYKPANEPNPIVITYAPCGKSSQHFSLSQKTRYARHLGTLPSTLRVMFDDTEPGGFFFVRDRKMLRLTDDQVKSVVFSNPVWVAEPSSGPRPAGVAPPIPSGAKMGRHSLFSDEAGNVSAILVEEGTLPMFDTEPERAAVRPRA